MKKKPVNALRLLGQWKRFLAAFEEKGVHTQAFPEDVLRSASEDRIVFYAPESKIVFGAIFKDIPLVVVLLIHPGKPAVDIVQLADDKARSFLVTDDSFTYPADCPQVTAEDRDARTREVLAMAFPEEIVQQLLSGQDDE